ANQVAVDQGGRVQPQPGKDGTLVKARVGPWQRFVLAVTQHEPVDGTIADTPDEILAHTIATVDAKFGMQVDADGAGRHLHGKFGSSDDVAVLVDGSLTTTCRLDQQQTVWLWFIVEVEPDGRVVAEADARRKGPIDTQPGDQVAVGFAMTFKAYRRRHVDDSF